MAATSPGHRTVTGKPGHPPTGRSGPATTDVVLVGMGPWGLAVLERIVTSALERGAGPPTTVHVVDPGTPGSGVYGGAQPDYLILNTPCGQHSMYPFPGATAGRAGTGFFEWAQASGYRWVGDRCEITTRGRPVTPHDFLPRRLLGEYLAWFYGCLVREAPPWLSIVHHRTTATAVEADGRRERVRLADGTVVDADHVVITTGHTPNNGARPGALSPYPVTDLGRTVPAGASVGLQGMGLAALDVVIALTVGRGGSFVRRDGLLRYRPSGREPHLALFSRSGVPYCAKSPDAADITAEFQPLICTPQAVAALRGDGPRRRIDARTELWPMLLAEMATCFYAQSARLADGPAAAGSVAQHLATGWEEGRFEQVAARLAERYGRFDPTHVLAGHTEPHHSAKDYEAWVNDLIASDLAAAVVPGGASPLKLAYEVPRALRDTIRSAVEFGGLTPASHRDFQSDIRCRITRAVAGPPAHRAEQLLALVDAGIVGMPFGPSPTVTSDGDGAVVSSRHLDRPHRQRVDRLVAAYIDQPGVHDSASPLLRQLYAEGRVRQFRVDGEELGSIDLTDDFHPVRDDGEPEHRLWVFGALTEGVRYYTAYIPSPSSRVRAFVDAQVCAERILETTR